MKKNILRVFATLIATVIVMVGTLLVVYFMKEQMSIVSFLVGCLGLLILLPAMNQWEKRFLDLFGVEDEDKS